MKKLFVVGAISTLFMGCASVPMESVERSERAKQFDVPTEGKAGLYVYRTSGPGTALKKDIWVDGDCLGQSAPNVFFYRDLEAGKQYTVSTESEFSPNELTLETRSGELYFVEQYIKLGLVVGGADLELVPEEEGKAEVSELELAVPGECST